ncbi:MAG: putative Rossmann fold flavoprotein [Planctomycetota bacterium]|jgi:predicted Rossmann fold flavoprotein
MVQGCDYDVVVIGAGAAGIMAATEAADGGAKTLLLEKNRKAGIKILASGGTRCNVTSTLPIRELGTWFGKKGERFLRYGLHEFGPDDIRRILLHEGVETLTFPLEKVFPKSGRAADVLEALLARLNRTTAELALEEGVVDLEKKDDFFRVKTAKRRITCRRAIVTVGGVSYPKTGTTGDGYPWLRNMGHKIVNPRPALVPIVVRESWVRELTGIAVEDVVVSANLDNGKSVYARRRPLLFTHRGLSGPGPMDISGHLDSLGGKRQLQIDWLPDRKEEEINQLLHDSSKRRQLMLNVLPGEFPRRLSVALLGQAGIHEDRTSSDLSKLERLSLVQTLKRNQIDVSGTEGFAKAEVTAGGVDLSEIVAKTMESKLVPGLHVAGEILNIDGPIGGFNFQAAFSTGTVAGRAAAAMVAEEK